MMKGKWKFGLVLLAISLIASASSASDIKAAARAAMSKYQKAVITVRVVAKVKSPRGEEENQFEVIGSVIDPSGLTVVSAQSIDPAAMVRALLATMGRQGQDAMAKFDSDITQTTMILQDGTEVDADVVLKDADLDLAFVRPRKTQSFDSIPLKPRGKPLEALEDIFVIDRLERSENRVTALNIGMIQAVVRGPRVFYIANQELSASSQGCIAFDVEGNPVGLFVAKQKQSSGDKGMAALMSMMAGGGISASIQIIRPIEDVLEDATQAKEARVPQSESTQSQP
ncbi:MAG TPA: serine protease [Acidobacteriota bacterium]|nr:serine protease [Acidobacteriota bacterium]